MRRDPGTDDGDDDKLIPEWGVAGDDQIIGAGLAVFAIGFLLLFGWNWLQNDDEPTDTAGAALAALNDVPGSDATADEVGAGAGLVAAAVPASTIPVETTAPNTTSTTPTTAPTSTAAPTSTLPSGPDLDALTAGLAPLPGDLTAVVVGSAVTLTGYVADATEEAAAIEAARSAERVESVSSELVLLEPAVAQVLADQGVVVATTDGVGTEITVSGTIQSEADREPTIAAARAVPGVTSITDELSVGAAEALNELPTIPFATGSAIILPEGQTIVAEAAALIDEAGEASFEVQGYTDITGDDQANLELSQARAAAVVDALIAAGVAPDALEARGFGETDRFALGTSPAALAANRVVRFLQIA